MKLLTYTEICNHQTPTQEVIPLSKLDPFMQKRIVKGTNFSFSGVKVRGESEFYVLRIDSLLKVTNDLTIVGQGPYFLSQYEQSFIPHSYDYCPKEKQLFCAILSNNTSSFFCSATFSDFESPQEYIYLNEEFHKWTHEPSQRLHFLLNPII
jgi:hypothetical protein